MENAVSVFHIDNDEVKGRIIGREGRNIRALEAATGVEIVVDDTPESITLSAYDPIRREVARLALHQLVQDGRIHPARIEEVVAKVTKQVEEEMGEYIDIAFPPEKVYKGQESYSYLGEDLDKLYTRLWLQVKVS